MPVMNQYFAPSPSVVQGAVSEQNILEDLVEESITIYGSEVVYIPRTQMSKDEILGEDRLSKFQFQYPIPVYFEEVDNFSGAGFMIQKFGLQVEQSATLVVSKRTWQNIVGVTGNTKLPRPCEGDLIYFPLSKGLFEIMFVVHDAPFYQLGKNYTYKMQVELFRYASERIDTGTAAIDVFESLHTFNTDTTITQYGRVESVTVTNQGSGYTSAPVVTFPGSPGTGATAIAVLGSGATAGKVVSINVLTGGAGYTPATSVLFTGGGGTGAIASPLISIDIDKPDSYGDNTEIKKQASSIVFSESNPFG